MSNQAAVIPVLVALALGGCGSEEPKTDIEPPTMLDKEGKDALRNMLGRTEENRPGDCELYTAIVRPKEIAVQLRCGAEKKRLEMMMLPPDAPGESLAVTERFAIRAGAKGALPEGLVADFEGRIRGHEIEGGWEWARVGVLAEDLGEEYVELHERRGDIRERYAAGLELYRQGKHDEALAIYTDLAKVHPWNGVLGNVVATLAGGKVELEVVRDLERQAAANPDDPLPTFMAGVGNHYYAHDSAQTVEEKKKHYAQAIVYLERLVDVYDLEPRLFIYLAVSYFRLGKQEKAEAMIARALPLGADDPDAWYCRAEISQRTNIERSLHDLDIYLSTMERFIANGAVASESKLQRVRDMRAHLLAVSKGEREPVEIFDPLQGHLAPDAPEPAPTSWGWIAVVAGLILGLGFVLRQRSASSR